MALATAAVALAAVNSHGAIHLGLCCFGWVGAHFGHLMKWRERHVEAVLGAPCNLLVALATALRRIWERRILTQSIMCRLPVRISRIPAVALITTYLAVILILGKLTVHKDLFVRSQRLHLPSSALAFGQGRFGLSWSSDFCKFTGYLDQLLRVCVARKTLALFGGGLGPRCARQIKAKYQY
jgi:hypothetical protein